jgi:acetoin utilization protein AcuB
MPQSTWYDRTAELRQLAKQEPHRAGTETLRLLEDWLYESANQLGFKKNHGGMREYIDFIAKRGRLSDEEAARARRYVDVRNCISHRSGLLISASLAEELLHFVALLFRSEAMDAEHLMTAQPHVVQESDNLREARDWMLHHGVSRVPVVRGERVVGLLTNRDLLALQASLRDHPAPDSLTVRDAMGADSLETIAFLPPTAPYDEVLASLQQPETAAIFVTTSGLSTDRLLGVITVSNLLPKL